MVLLCITYVRHLQVHLTFFEGEGVEAVAVGGATFSRVGIHHCGTNQGFLAVGIHHIAADGALLGEGRQASQHHADDYEPPAEVMMFHHNLIIIPF